MRTWIASLALAASACATTPAEDPYIVDVGGGGAADDGGFPVIDVDAGDRLTLGVSALPAGASVEQVDLSEHMIAVRVHGGARALVVRRTFGELDPYAIVKNTTKETLAESNDQTLAPSAGANDSLVVVTSTDELVLISGEDLRSGGRFTLDVIALPAGQLRTAEGTITRVIGDDLREHEATRAQYAASGWVTERTDGLLEEATAKIPLDQRAAVRGFVTQINETRTTLFSELAPSAPAAVGSDLAAVWAALAN
jgi:hypothetical protein